MIYILLLIVLKVLVRIFTLYFIFIMKMLTDNSKIFNLNILYYSIFKIFLSYLSSNKILNYFNSYFLELLKII